MAKRKDNDEPIDSYLVKDKNEIINLISKQINAAIPLLEMEVKKQKVVDTVPFGGQGEHWIYDKKQKEDFYAAYSLWDDFNKELFTRMFADANNTDKHRYESAGEKMFWSGHEDYVEEQKKTIRGKVNYLKGFLNRVVLIPSKIDDNNILDKDNFHETRMKKTKIFISHKTEDSNYAKAIIAMLVALGVNHKDIFCSSVDGYGIPFGRNIFDTLHNQFDDYRLFVIFIHSPRYYKSAISLNEMGAAWILRSEHRSFLTSDCEFSMLTGVIHRDEIAFKAGQKDTEHLLHDFRNDIRIFFSLDNINDAIWETTKNEFIEKVQSFSYQNNDNKESEPSSKEEHGVPNDYASFVIDYMKQAGRDVKMSEISSYIGLSIASTSRIIRQLVLSGVIVANGTPKYCKYRLA